MPRVRENVAMGVKVQVDRATMVLRMRSVVGNDEAGDGWPAQNMAGTTGASGSCLVILLSGQPEAQLDPHPTIPPTPSKCMPWPLTIEQTLSTT